MQPSTYLVAKSVKGAITITSRYHFNKLAFLGASCSTSVTPADGILDTIVVIPKQKVEVVALGVIYADGSANGPHVQEAFLLEINKGKDDKFTINLESPFASSANAVGQVISEKKSFFIRLLLDNRGSSMLLSESKKWLVGGASIENNQGIDPPNILAPDVICQILAEPFNREASDLGTSKGDGCVGA